MTAPEPRKCKQCDRPYVTYTLQPCRGEHCLDCQLFEPADSHWEMEYDVNEVVAYQCPHGTDYNQLCKGCGNKVGGWGVGAAGFGDLCGPGEPTFIPLGLRRAPSAYPCDQA